VLFGFAVVAVFLAHSLGFLRLDLVTASERYLYDFRVRLFQPPTVDDRIVIIDIDEKSLAEIGRWPWGRNHLADLLISLTDRYRVAVAGFDVVFAEPDESSGLRILEQLADSRLRGDGGFRQAINALRPELDHDGRFAAALRGRPAVLGAYFDGSNEARRSGALPAPAMPLDYFRNHAQSFQSYRGFTANLPAFQEAAMAGGHVLATADRDGGVRRAALLIEHDGALYQSFALAVARSALGRTELRPGFPDDWGPMEWLEVASEQRLLRIPVDASVAALVPFRGKRGSFPYVSAVDVIAGKVDPGLLEGRIALVGSSAAGLNDLRATPVDPVLPGVELQASLIAGILDGSIKEEPAYLYGADILLLALLGSFLALALPFLSPARGSLLALVVIGGLVAGNLALWHSANLVMPLAGTGLALFAIYLFNMSWGYFVESRSKRQFADLFGQYVPPELVDEMAKDPTAYSMEGRNELLTVLFSDVRGFTTISEGLDPKELAHLMNEYLGAMTEVVRRKRGTLDKYIGDAIMAFWGAPVADLDHAAHAIETALEMQVELRKLDAPFRQRGWPELHIGIGINSGTMTVGDMGSPVRKSYTVMGDAVNLGSRLEGITKEYGVGILVGEDTQRLAPGFAYRQLDRVRVKGKDEPVAIYEPLGRKGEIPAAEMEALRKWEDALAHFRQQHWDAAEAGLLALRAADPGRHLYELYLERVALLRKAPPGPGWDGVTTFKTK
jgi:adenylate cyclase